MTFMITEDRRANGRIVEDWVFELMSDQSRAYLLLDSYSRRSGKPKRKRLKTEARYNRSGTGDLSIADVPLPDTVQEKATKRLLENTTVVMRIE